MTYKPHNVIVHVLYVKTNHIQSVGKYFTNYKWESYSPRIYYSVYVWQSRIEIEYYFITYFKRITEFNAL